MEVLILILRVNIEVLHGVKKRKNGSLLSLSKRKLKILDILILKKMPRLLIMRQQQN